MNIRQEMKELCACLCRQDELYAALALAAAIPLGVSPVLLVIGVVLLVPSLIALWTMRCPACGAWIAKQANVFALLRFSCVHCGFSADGAEPEEDR